MIIILKEKKNEPQKIKRKPFRRKAMTGKSGVFDAGRKKRAWRRWRRSQELGPFGQTKNLIGVGINNREIRKSFLIYIEAETKKKNTNLKKNI